MRYFTDRMIAKSTPENWGKEESGLKNNTIREVSSEERKDLERFWSSKGEYVFRPKKIAFENTETGEHFERDISDISYFNSYEDKIKGEKTMVHVYVISFKDTKRQENAVCGDEKARDDVQDAMRHFVSMDISGPGEDKSCLVIAKQHQNGTLEIIDTKHF